jgi:hypothetical protein
MKFGEGNGKCSPKDQSITTWLNIRRFSTTSEMLKVGFVQLHRLIGHAWLTLEIWLDSSFQTPISKSTVHLFLHVLGKFVLLLRKSNTLESGEPQPQSSVGWPMRDIIPPNAWQSPLNLGYFLSFQQPKKELITFLYELQWVCLTRIWEHSAEIHSEKDTPHS